MHLGDRTDSINVTLVRFRTRRHLRVALLSSLLFTAPGNDFSPYTQVSLVTKVQPLIKQHWIGQRGSKQSIHANQCIQRHQKDTHWSVRGREQLIKSFSLQFVLHLWTA